MRSWQVLVSGSTTESDLEAQQALGTIKAFGCNKLPPQSRLYYACSECGTGTIVSTAAVVGVCGAAHTHATWGITNAVAMRVTQRKAGKGLLDLWPIAIVLPTSCQAYLNRWLKPCRPL